MRKEDDVFDRLMEYKIFDWFRPYYRKYKEFWLYALFGAGTVAINVGAYAIFTEVNHLGILVANAIAWVFATLFAFLTNRAWVFTSHKRGAKAFMQQMASFFFGRFLTLLLEEWMLYYFVGVLGWSNMVIKAVAQVVVILSNYLVSKLIVFRRKR